MTDPLAALDLPGREVMRAIKNGATAASCSVYEQDGGIRIATRMDEDAVATLEFTAPRETDVRTYDPCSLDTALVFAAAGAHIRCISSPDPDARTWTAAAILDPERHKPLPAELRPTVPGQIWLLVCHDDRGLSAAPYSRLLSPSGRPLGDLLSSAIARTRIDGAAERMRKAHPQPEDFPTFAAAAVAEVFNTPEAISGADGGPALVKWVIARHDLTAAGAWNTVANSVVPPDRRAPNHRRASIFAELLKAAEIDAFGEGVNSPRSIRTLVSLDAPIGEPGDGDLALAETLVGAGDIAPGVLAGLEIDDLLAAAALSDREREVFELLRADLTQREIAERLGIAPGTVAALSSRLKKKLRQAGASM